MPIALSDLRGELAYAFPARFRSRGKALFDHGAVEELQRSGACLTARVQGTERYWITIPLEPDSEVGELLPTCSCPAFERFEACKHIWAVLLEIEESLKDGYLTDTSRPTARPSRLQDLRERISSGASDPWEALRTDRHRLLYCVDLEQSKAKGGLVIQVMESLRLQSGKWGKPRRHEPFGYRARRPEDPQDFRILSRITGAVGSYGASLGSHLAYRYDLSGSFLLDGPLLRDIVEDLCATGRLSWRSPHRASAALTWDGPQPWNLRATIEERDGLLELTAHLERDDERMELAAPELLLPAGLLITDSVVAPVELHGAFGLVEELLEDGPLRVEPSEALALASLLQQLPAQARGAVSGLPALEPEDPVPHLRVEGSVRRTSRLTCAVLFDYGGTRVDPRGPDTAVDAAGRFLARNAELERSAVSRFLELGGRVAPGTGSGAAPGTGSGAAPGYVEQKDFPALVRALFAEGWTIEADGALVRRPGATRSSISSGVDWFDLEVAVEFGDQSASFPELLAAARAGGETVLLGDGTRGLLPERWLESWGLLTIGRVDEDRVRFPRSQGWLLDALLAQRTETSVDADFARYRERLAKFDGLAPRREPRGFRGELRPYQRDGLGWFKFLEDLGLGGCLADDMGLGKTVQVLALLEQARATRKRKKTPPAPTLVVAPRSLVFNWLDEAARFAPQLETLDHTGPGRWDPQHRIAEVDLVLTTYGTLRRDAAQLSEIEFERVVLDEAQAIKNASSQTAKAARLLRARHRLALSGTPVENHLGELWSLFEFLNPGMLGSSRTFGELVSQSGDEGFDPRTLARALRPFFLRRKKEDVLHDLPPKTEQVLHCVLSPKERKRYDQLRDHFRRELLERESQVGLARMKIHVLEALLRLRQAACHPALLDPELADEPSAKLTLLVSRLEELVAEGNKALVFSQFTTLLRLVRQRLDSAGVPYEYLDGRTRKRKPKVERFQNDPDCPVFLISIKAGGHGLNLTAADYVFVLDPWWNPAVEAQAVDRAHRIGRTRPVVAYRLIARDTIEERVRELQERKRKLTEALFDEGRGGLADLTREDLERLFSD